MVMPLTYSNIRSGHLDAIREFAKAQDVNFQLEHGTPLTLATFEGRVNVVRLLLDAGADPDYPAENGWTPLIAASNDGRTRIVEILLEAGADPNKADLKGNTALHHLCFCPRKTAPEVARLLISKGANRLQTNHDGLTASRMALEKRMKGGYQSTVSQDLVYALAREPDQ